MSNNLVELDLDTCPREEKSEETLAEWEEKSEHRVERLLVQHSKRYEVRLGLVCVGWRELSSDEKENVGRMCRYFFLHKYLPASFMKSLRRMVEEHREYFMKCGSLKGAMVAERDRILQGGVDDNRVEISDML